MALAVSVAITGNAASLVPAPTAKRIKHVRDLWLPTYEVIPCMAGNPVTGILGAEIPNNSPPRTVLTELFLPPSVEAA